MKIITISYFTPYKENIRGISALLYFILKARPQDIDVVLFSYNANKLNKIQIKAVEKELNINIQMLDFPKWYQFVMNHSVLAKICGLVLPKHINTYIPVPETVKKQIEQGCDYVWIYPYFFYMWSKEFPAVKFVVTGCDNNALFYDRCRNISYFNTWRKRISLNIHRNKALYTEKEFAKDNILVHYVGKEDVEAYKLQTNCTNAFFCNHPHYKVLPSNIKFNSDKIRVLIAGKNDFYMQSKVEPLMIKIFDSSSKLSDKIQITFLGNGWDSYVAQLGLVGFECNQITWVDDYIEEIIKYDVQIIPIAVGTGTKGKVLDALANGLLCIGTDFALENIEVENGKSCFIYHEESEVVSLLLDIYSDKEKYEKIAKEGQKCVLEYHSPQIVSNLFFNRIRDFKIGRYENSKI